MKNYSTALNFELANAPSGWRVRLRDAAVYCKTSVQRENLKESFRLVHPVEKFLLLFAWNWLVWFVCFDVYSSSKAFENTKNITVIFWDLMFFLAFAFHAGSIVLRSSRARFAACFLHTVIWVMWVMIVATSAINSTAAPTLIGLATMAMYSMNRVYKSL